MQRIAPSRRGRLFAYFTNAISLSKLLTTSYFTFSGAYFWFSRSKNFRAQAILVSSIFRSSSDDIEPEIRAIADVCIDYGLMKYHPYRQSSTLLNLETLEVVRYGSCYEDIRDILKRHFSHDPGARLEA